MLTFITALTLAIVTWVTGQVGAPAPATSAAILLDENRELCLDLARGDSAVDPVARAARRALAAETIALAEEAAVRVQDPAVSEPLRLALRLERRLCRGLLAQGEPAALAGELERVLEKLLRHGSIDETQRERVLGASLDRLESAVLAAVEKARTEASLSGKGAGEVEDAREEGEGRVERGVSEQVNGWHGFETGVVPAVRRPHGRAGGGSVGLTNEVRESWDPSPKELARRRRARQAAFRKRVLEWRHEFRRELASLSAARAALRSELAHRSLEQLRMSCSKLGDVARTVDYLMVLGTPEPTLRSDLDRLLAGYVAAGRWCEERRYSFAWLEIEEADRRWRRLEERIERIADE